MELGEPFAAGRDADVYALDAHRVLRRYRRGGDVAGEASLMEHVRSFGFPVPVVYEADGADLVLERLTGPTMSAAGAAGDLEVGVAAGILADLHRQLHQVPAPGGTGYVVHLDLHPENVLLTPRGPMVIDWRNAGPGPADLDLAMTALLIAQVAVDPAHPHSAPADMLLAAFLDQAGGDPLARLADVVSRRRADPNVTADEVCRLGAAAERIVARIESWTHV